MDKILIVDPITQSSDLIRQCLSSTGYEIYTAESGLNAIAKVSLFCPDVVLLNAELPDISSYDVCKRIKSNPDTEYTLILFISSLNTHDSRVRAIQVGADDYLEKNFDAYLLISKVNSLLRVKHLSNQLKQKYVELEEKKPSIRPTAQNGAPGAAGPYARNRHDISGYSFRKPLYPCFRYWWRLL
jgi:DNA-binding response OmpR family regulator